MILLQKVRDMTKLKPTIQPPNNAHILRDSRRAQKQLARLTALLDVSYTICEVEVDRADKIRCKQKRVKIVVGVDI